MLRAVYQTALVIAADQNPSFGLLQQVNKIGLEAGREEQTKASALIHHGFVSLENQAKYLIVGKKSGLKQITIENLEFFLRLMHKTVHPLNLHITLNLRSAFSSQVSLFPKPDKEQLSQYMNISNFIGWMTLRILTLFNRNGRLFNDDWMRRTNALDAAFEALVTGFADLDKPLGRAVIDLIDKKFTFNKD